jgi:hypothetical protein
MHPIKEKLFLVMPEGRNLCTQRLEGRLWQLRRNS